MMRVVLVLMTGALVCGAPVAAHHSYSEYDRNLLLQFDGVLEAIEVMNPHSLLTVKTADATYTFEWAAARGLERWRVPKDQLKAGDTLVLTGNPRRDVATSGIVNLRTIHRPSDGWKWPNR